MSTNTITATAITINTTRCPECRESVVPVELKRSLQVTRRQRQRYQVQYECPDCAKRWWGFEWKER